MVAPVSDESVEMVELLRQLRELDPDAFEEAMTRLREAVHLARTAALVELQFLP